MKINKTLFLSYFIKSCLWVIWIVLLISVIAIFANSYQDFVNYVLLMTGKLDKREIFMRDLLPSQKFNIIRVLLSILLVLYSVFTYLISPKIYFLAGKFKEFLSLSGNIIKSGIKSFLDLTFFQKMLLTALVLFILVFRLYYFFIYPFSNDELFTYLYFVKPGFFAAASYYPGPNNHILYSLSSNFVDLFTENDHLIIRLPSLVAGLLSVLILLFYFLKRNSFSFAFLVTLFYTSYTNVFYYSFHGRGYVFVYLFFILLLISVLEILNQKNESFWKVVFVLSAVLGFYSIPIFLYPFSSLIVFVGILVLYRRQFLLLKKFLIWSIIAGVLTSSLYLPVFVVSGWDSVTGNSFIKSLRAELFFSSLPDYLKTLTEYWWDSDWGMILTLAALIGGSLVLLINRKVDWLILIGCIFLIPLLILMVQKVQPFVRIWDYLLILFAILGALIFYYLLNFISNQRMKSIFLLLAFLFVNGLLYVKIYTFIQKGFSFYTDLNQSMEKLFERGFKTAYVAEETYFLYVNYFAEKTNRDVLLEHEPVITSPEIIIVPVNKALNYSLEAYKLIEKNKHVTIWVKKQ